MTFQSNLFYFRLNIPLALTQPDQFRNRISRNLDSFSQPQVSGTTIEIDLKDQNSNVFVRNTFARFMCQCSIKRISERLTKVLQTMLVQFQKSLSSDRITKIIIYFQTVDRRKCPLVGQISLQILNDSVLVIVKKTRGNPIEYARFFKFIVDQCTDLF